MSGRLVCLPLRPLELKQAGRAMRVCDHLRRLRTPQQVSRASLRVKFEDGRGDEACCPPSPRASSSRRAAKTGRTLVWCSWPLLILTLCLSFSLELAGERATPTAASPGRHLRPVRHRLARHHHEQQAGAEWLESSLGQLRADGAGVAGKTARGGAKLPVLQADYETDSGSQLDEEEEEEEQTSGEEASQPKYIELGKKLASEVASQNNEASKEQHASAREETSATPKLANETGKSIGLDQASWLEMRENGSDTIMETVFSHIDRQWKFAEVVLIIVFSTILNLVTIIGNIMVLISFKMDRS